MLRTTGLAVVVVLSALCAIADDGVRVTATAQSVQRGAKVVIGAALPASMISQERHIFGTLEEGRDTDGKAVVIPLVRPEGWTGPTVYWQPLAGGERQFDINGNLPTEIDTAGFEAGIHVFRFSWREGNNVTPMDVIGIEVKP